MVYTSQVSGTSERYIFACDMWPTVLVLEVGQFDPLLLLLIIIRGVHT